jgi:hypothetical protein
MDRLLQLTCMTAGWGATLQLLQWSDGGYVGLTGLCQLAMSIFLHLRLILQWRLYLNGGMNGERMGKNIEG